MADHVNVTPDIQKRLDALAQKYQASGQELLDFLDGLLYQDYNTYWDYIHLDTLLSLQNPVTDIADEEVFIMYHQITELYFKLSLNELKQLAFDDACLNKARFLEKTQRINRYFGALTHSFGVMEKGMDRNEFLKFRMSLIPASGFQSVQYRMIELACTDMINLTEKSVRPELSAKADDVDSLYEHIYWKRGATLADTGAKTLTLKQFEKKYSEKLKRHARKFMAHNLWRRFLALPPEDQKDQDLIDQLRLIDLNVNVNWPLQHYKTSVVYLARRPHDVRATGGTNWQKYLPPRYQKRIFFPDLWTAQEQEEWGKSWVQGVLDEINQSSVK
jgi:tryptophan 2,3-dioxygenase